MELDDIFSQPSPLSVKLFNYMKSFNNIHCPKTRKIRFILWSDNPMTAFYKILFKSSSDNYRELNYDVKLTYIFDEIAKVSFFFYNFN